MKKQIFGFIKLFFIFSTQLNFGQYDADSLKKLLLFSKNKAAIYNYLSETFINDSLELSMTFADSALFYSIIENNKAEKAKALFNCAEVFTYQYEPDSAKHYYNLALNIFRETGDNYNISYTLNNIGWISNTYGHFDDAVKYYTESLDYLDKDRYPDDLSHIYINIGNAFHQLGKYHTAIRFFHKAIAVAGKTGYEPAFPIAYNGIGLAYKYLSNYDSAIVYYNAMLEIDKKNGTERDIAIDYHNIGSLYYQWKLYRQALDYYDNALEIYQKTGNKNDISLILNNIGLVYKKMKQYDEALNYFSRSLHIDSITGIEINRAVRYNNIGEVYAEMGDYPGAIDYYYRSLEINKKSGQQSNIAGNLLNIGNAFIKTKRYNKAELLLNEGLLISDSIQNRSMEAEFLNSLSLLNEITENYKKALYYHNKLDDVRDSIFSTKNQMALADMKTKYDLDKKEEQILILNERNRIKETRISAYQNTLIITIAAVFLIMALLSILYYQYKQKARAYTKLVEKNRILLASNGNSKRKNKKLPKTKHQIIKEKLEHHFAKDKIYLNPNLTVKDVAEKLDSNPHYISEVISGSYNMNFTALLNEYRVAEACRLLGDEKNSYYTIEGIAQMAGFKSKSVFNRAFKSVTGITPSYFRKSLDLN